MHIGLAGAGRMGAHHAEVLAACAGVSAVTVVDPDEQRACDVAAAVGASAATDMAAVVAGGEVDAVVIAAPTPLHAPLIELAAGAGLPCFCEKPIALDLASTTRVLDAVDRAGTYLQLGFQRRFDEGFTRARDAVADGAVGTLRLVRLTTCDPAPPHPEYLAVSGGVFRDMHIHDFDALRYVTGDEVEEVYAAGAVLVDDAVGPDGDVDTTGLVLRMRSGALVTIAGCRRDPLGYDVRLELLGEEDALCVGIDARTPLRSVEDAGLLGGEDGWEFFVDRFAPAYGRQLRAFVTNVEAGRASPCTAHDGREALLLALAAEESVRRGVPVRMSQLRAEVLA